MKIKYKICLRCPMQSNYGASDLSGQLTNSGASLVCASIVLEVRLLPSYFKGTKRMHDISKVRKECTITDQPYLRRKLTFAWRMLQVRKMDVALVWCEHTVIMIWIPCFIDVVYQCMRAGVGRCPLCRYTYFVYLK